MSSELKFKRVGTHTFPLPRRVFPTDAGVDLASTELVTLYYGDTKIIPTGWAVHLEPGQVGWIVPRSGMSYKTKMRIANSPGTIDSEYRGELKIIMENIGEQPIRIDAGDRIAQFVYMNCLTGIPTEIFDHEETDRGDGGFGHTGD